MKRTLAAIALLASMLSHATPGPAPNVNFQGRLTNSSGIPINASVSIVFTIYSAASGGIQIWTETQSVPVNNGDYSVLLGAVNPLAPAVFGGPTFLGVKVGTDAEMTPRTQLTFVPYAFHANQADNASNAVNATNATNSTYATLAQSLTGLGDSTNTAPLGGNAPTECVLTEMRLFAAQILPNNFLPASGQILAISQWQAQFTLLGTTYGGDGITTFQLPDLRTVTPNNMTWGICMFGIFPSF